MWKFPKMTVEGFFFVPFLLWIVSLILISTSSAPNSSQMLTFPWVPTKGQQNMGWKSWLGSGPRPWNIFWSLWLITGTLALPWAEAPCPPNPSLHCLVKDDCICSHKILLWVLFPLHPPEKLRVQYWPPGPRKCEVTLPGNLTGWKDSERKLGEPWALYGQLVGCSWAKVF
jgi:hypothetical protein